MYPVSSPFLEALRGPHTVVVRADVIRSGATVLPDVAVLDGSVRVDGGSLVRRELTATLAWPADPTLLLTELRTPGTEVRVQRGIRYPSGRVEWAPCGIFAAEKVTDAPATPGTASVVGPDRMARVIADSFASPRAATAGVTVAAMIATLIGESVPGAPFEDRTGASSTVPAGVVWEESRADAVVDLAKSIGAVVFATVEGGFVLTRPKTTADAADWSVDTGARGVYLGGTRESSTSEIVNSWTVYSSATDGSAPVFATVEDTDPASPTRVSGPLGRRARRYSSPLLTSVAQCRRAGWTLLRKSLGGLSSVSLEVMVNPALDAGDRLDVFLPDGSVQRHVVASFSLPLTVSGSLSIATRVSGDVGEFTGV